MVKIEMRMVARIIIYEGVKYVLARAWKIIARLYI
jgi:hypothetical protein